MVIAMGEDTWLRRQQLGDLLELGSYSLLVISAHRLALSGHHPIFQKVVELPHQQRHIEAAMESQTGLVRWRSCLLMNPHQHINHMTIEQGDVGSRSTLASLGQQPW